MRLRSRVIVDKRFTEYSAEVDRRVSRALGKAVGVGVAAAKGTPSRYRIGAIIGSTRPERVQRDRRTRGWIVSIRASDWRAIFFERGTRGRRKGKLAGGAAPGGGTGVRAHHFLRRGLKAARSAIVDALRNELR